MTFKNVGLDWSDQHVHFIILPQRTADQTAICTVYLLSEFAGATWSSAWGSLQIHSVPSFADLLLPPLFSYPSPFWGYFSISWSFLLRNCLFLSAPVASLFQIVVVIIWFSHFPICCTISSFLTWKRHITKHCVWYVNRKLEDKWCATAIDWFRLCTQTSTSRVAEWK